MGWGKGHLEGRGTGWLGEGRLHGNGGGGESLEEAAVGSG